MRYLELRLDKNAMDIYFEDMSDECVDMLDTYDLSDKEPLILPSKLPLYLINGTFGIAGGFQGSVPTHNPIEVIDELIKLIKDPTHIISLVPDFPTGGYILNNKDLKKSYTTGRSKYKCRGHIDIEENENQLVITEIPYMTTLDKIKEDLICCTKERKDRNKGILPPLIPEIEDVSDGSSDGLMRLIVKLKKGSDFELARLKIFANTKMEDSKSFILIGCHDRNFVEYENINEVLEEWIDFRRTTIKRIKLGKIKKMRYRIHIIAALLDILDPKCMDEVINKIRNKCKSKPDVVAMLINDYNLDKIQADAIAEYKLYQLTSMNLTKLKDEKDDLESEIIKETIFFKNKDKIDELIIEDLEKFRIKYKNIKRKTKIVNKEEFDSLDNNVIADSMHTIIITKNGYIKKLNTIQSQKRNGKGNNIGKLKEGDYPVLVEEVNNKDSLFIFTNVGKAYKYSINDLISGTTSTLGNYIGGKINNEIITSCIKIPHDINMEDYSILFATKINKIKLTKLSEFKNLNNSGIIATKLIEGDSILNAILINHNDLDKVSDILLTRSFGYSSVMDISDIPNISRTTLGSLAFNNNITKEGDITVSISARKETDTHIFVLSEQGYGKLVDINEFTKVKRGARGVLNAKLKEDDKTLSALYCNLDQEITIITNKNIIKINTSDISISKRPTLGVMIKKLTEDEKILDITVM